MTDQVLVETETIEVLVAAPTVEVEVEIVGGRGVQGEPGPQGPEGAPSTVPGPTGATGATGATGPPGPTGPQGEPSTVPGPQGPSGATGPQGATGSTGSQGVPGPQGVEGPPGEVLIVELTQAEYDALPVKDPDTLYVISDGPGPVEGPPGPAGPQGATGPAGATGAASTVPGPQGPPGADGEDGATGATGPQGDPGPAGAAGAAGMGSESQLGFSQPSGSVWLPTGAILENFSRYTAQIVAQAALSLGAIRSWPMGLLRAGHTLTGIGFVCGAASVGSTFHWAGIATVPDHIVRAISPDLGAAATAANTPKTFTFNTPYTASVDTFLIGFVMYAGGTVPTVMGFSNTAGVTSALLAPVLCASHQTGQTTPPSVGFTLAPITAINQQVYLYGLGTT